MSIAKVVWGRSRKDVRGGQAVLPGLGLAILDGLGGIRLQLMGREITAMQPTVAMGDGIEIWSEPSASAVLVLHQQGDVASMDLRTGDTTLVGLSTLKREEDADFRGAGLVETQLGPLVVYELGVVAFSLDGTVRWRAEVPTFQWFFRGVRGDLVVFEHEYYGTWTFDLRTGAKNTPGAGPAA